MATQNTLATQLADWVAQLDYDRIVCPRPDTHLMYMIKIVLTTEFALLPIAAIAGSSLRLRFRSGGDR